MQTPKHKALVTKLRKLPNAELRRLAAANGWCFYTLVEIASGGLIVADKYVDKIMRELK